MIKLEITEAARRIANRLSLNPEELSKKAVDKLFKEDLYFNTDFSVKFIAQEHRMNVATVSAYLFGYYNPELKPEFESLTFYDFHKGYCPHCGNEIEVKELVDDLTWECNSCNDEWLIESNNKNRNYLSI